MPKSKKNIKVRDLKPNKDAKGGGPHGVAGQTIAGPGGPPKHPNNPGTNNPGMNNPGMNNPGMN